MVSPKYQVTQDTGLESVAHGSIMASDSFRIRYDDDGNDVYGLKTKHYIERHHKEHKEILYF